MVVYEHSTIYLVLVLSFNFCFNKIVVLCFALIFASEDPALHLQKAYLSLVKQNGFRE